jgi:uncharacterized protein YebE (UPF0316 family)
MDWNSIVSQLASPEAWLVAGGIFILRVGNTMLDTIRLLFMLRDKRFLTWVLGFFQTIIYVIVIGSVLSNLNNLQNIVGYSAGFATGNILGMMVEERLALGHIKMSIISSTSGAAIAERLRIDGFAVTEIPARGRDGTVSVLQCDVIRKHLDKVEKLVLATDPEAFITCEDVRPVRAGFWRK